MIRLSNCSWELLDHAYYVKKSAGALKMNFLFTVVIAGI